MREIRKKLAVLALCAFCVVGQVMPVCAATKVHASAGKKESAERFEIGAAGTKADGTVGQDSPQQTGHSGESDNPGEAGHSGESANGGVSDNPQEPDNPGEPGNSGEPDSPQEPDNPGEPGNLEEPDSPQEPGNPEEPDHPQEPDSPDEPQELPVPKKLTGLRTTCQSDTKVRLDWDKSKHAAFYEIYRKTGSGSYKKLAKTKKESYTDKTVVYGRTYNYKVVPFNADGVKGKAANITFSHRQAVNIKTQKYTYDEMARDMKELAQAYSSYCELIPIGKSVQGRTIYDFAIGNPDAKRSLLVVSTLHAREYVCSAMLMREIEYYLRNYNKKLGGTSPAKLLQNLEIHYIVMANPDGVTISQTSYPRWKSNSRGVDLNRNFPAKKFYEGGKKGAWGYSGKKALSEPESKAIATFTKQLKRNQHLLGVVNYHAMGQIIYGDCSDKKLKSATDKMYRIARGLTGYRYAGDFSGKSKEKPIGGQYREYVMDLLGLPSITIEVGATMAPCAYREYDSVFEKNKLVVLKIAEALS